MKVLHFLQRQLGACLVFAGLAVHLNGFAQVNLPASPLVVRYAGVDYFHRWSKEDQHEFTPAGQEDLLRWQDMVTINVHQSIRDGDQLASLANLVLGRYTAAGKIIATDSVPRTEKVPAQHLVVAALRGTNVAEAVFARLVLLDDRGTVIVYSRRAYGPDAATVTGQWLEQNGKLSVDALMKWTAIPSHTVLKQLPSSK